jgi:hypothetical protein
MLPTTFFHSARRLLPSSTLLSLSNHAHSMKDQSGYLIPFYGHILSHHRCIIDSQFTSRQWNVIQRRLFSKCTTFPYTYQVQGKHITEINSSVFTPHHVLSDGTWYNESVCLSSDFSIISDSTCLLFSIETPVAEYLI